MEIMKIKIKVVLECLMVIDVQDTAISKEYEIPEWNIQKLYDENPDGFDSKGQCLPQCNIRIIVLITIS